MTWAPCSPDLNPTENLWALLKHVIRKSNTHFWMWESVLAASAKIGWKQIKKLTDFMDVKFMHVSERTGGYTSKLMYLNGKIFYRFLVQKIIILMQFYNFFKHTCMCVCSFTMYVILLSNNHSQLHMVLTLVPSFNYSISNPFSCCQAENKCAEIFLFLFMCSVRHIPNVVLIKIQYKGLKRFNKSISVNIGK